MKDDNSNKPAAVSVETPSVRVEINKATLDGILRYAKQHLILTSLFIVIILGIICTHLYLSAKTQAKFDCNYQAGVARHAVASAKFDVDFKKGWTEDKTEIAAAKQTAKDAESQLKAIQEKCDNL